MQHLIDFKAAADSTHQPEPLVESTMMVFNKASGQANDPKLHEKDASLLAREQFAVSLRRKRKEEIIN